MVVIVCNIVFEKNVLFGSNIYNVKLIWVLEGDFIVFILNGEVFGIVVMGFNKDEVYGFLGNILFL